MGDGTTTVFSGCCCFTAQSPQSLVAAIWPDSDFFKDPGRATFRPQWDLPHKWEPEVKLESCRRTRRARECRAEMLESLQYGIALLTGWWGEDLRKLDPQSIKAKPHSAPQPIA